MTVAGVVLVIFGGIALSGNNGLGWVFLLVGALLLIARHTSQPLVGSSQAQRTPERTPDTSPSSSASVGVPTSARPTVAQSSALPPIAPLSPPAPQRPVAKKPAAKRPPVEPIQPARIITRTTVRPGQSNLLDPFAAFDRPWSTEEERRLLVEYANNQDMSAIASAMRIDQREVAKRLIRLVFEATGELDAGDPPRNRARWSQLEFDKVLREVIMGLDLATVAASVDRTPLGVGWRLLERAPQPFEPSKQTRARLGLPPF